jgi:hypothetical protein
MKKRIKETQEGMVVKDVPRIVPGGYRLEI